MQHFKPSKDQIDDNVELLGGNLEIPENFVATEVTFRSLTTQTGTRRCSGELQIRLVKSIYKRSGSAQGWGSTIRWIYSSQDVTTIEMTSRNLILIVFCTYVKLRSLNFSLNNFFCVLFWVYSGLHFGVKISVLI